MASKKQSLDPAALAESGEAIFGPDWKTPMAEELGVGRRTISRWAAGDFNIPPGIAGELADVAERAASRLAAVIAKLRKM